MPIVRQVARIFFFIILALMTLFPPSYWATSPEAAEKPENLVAQAKKEGTLVLYCSVPLELMKPITEAYEQRYPFIKSTILRQSRNKIHAKVRTEQLAGQFLVDVIQSGGDHLYNFVKEGAFDRYYSAEAESLEAKQKEPGFWSAFYHSNRVTAYNKRLVNDPPRDLMDLLDPKWKGLIAMRGDEEDQFVVLEEQVIGKEQGFGYLKKLAAQKPRLYLDNALLVQLLAAGEFPIVFHASQHLVESAKGKGAPVDWVAMEWKGKKFTITQTSALALARNAPHPAAARLFVDFVLSKEGQELVSQLHQVPAKTRNVKLAYPNLIEGIEKYYVPIDIGKKIVELKKRYEHLFQ
ncbi:MAG: extracellular solute-binding protein [Deltaproteobacteria bacterium]|nr:extracellular solute-binding protein [Deltaproteobacteria bacterium]